MIWCSTWSLAPAAFTFGKNTVNVFAYPLEASAENIK